MLKDNITKVTKCLIMNELKRNSGTLNMVLINTSFICRNHKNFNQFKTKK